MYYFVNVVSDAGLANIELMHSALNGDGMTLQIDGVRVPEVGRCHVLLRQMDSRETAVNKHIVLDLASSDDLQTMLKQVSSFLC